MNYLINYRVVQFESVSAAAFRIRDGIVRTPCDVRIFIFKKTIPKIYFYYLLSHLTLVSYVEWTFT